jgi:tetratricopeptide (TPR) repeat protein
MERPAAVPAGFDAKCSFCGFAIEGEPECCGDCGALLHFDGAKLNVGKQYYPDFGSCSKCSALNIIGQHKCTNCGFEGNFTPVHGKATVATAAIFWLVIGIITIVLALPTFGVSLPVLFLCIWKYYKLVNDARKAEAGRQRYADQLLAEILQAHRERTVLAYKAVRLDIEAQDFRGALRKLDKCKELGIPSGTLAEAYAFAYMKNDDAGKAIPFLETHIANKDAIDLYQEMLIEAYLADGLKTDRAVQYCLDNYKRLGPTMKQRTVFRLASAFIQTKRNDELAVQVFREVLDDDPTDAHNLAGLARIFNSQEKPEDAVELCSSFSGHHSTESLGEFTRALDTLGRIDETALGVYRERLALEPTDSYSRMRLCQGLVRAGQYKDAIDVFREGLVREPANLRLRYHLALTLMQAGNIDGAIAECQQLMHQPDFETYRSRPDLHLLLGKCFAMKKLFSPALKQLRLAGQTPEVLERLYELGELADSAGNSAIAQQCWEEICAVDIAFKDVNTKLAKVPNVIHTA